MKKAVIASLIIIFILSLGYFIVPKAQSSALPYYTGEAISYNNRVIFGTGTVRGAEIFELYNNNIVRALIIRSDDPNERRVHDVIFNEEEGRLYIYLTNGPSIFKYDITALPEYVLVNKVKDNSKDYFYGLGKAGTNIFSVGTKNIKVWSNWLDVINTYDLDRKHAKSIAFSANGNFVFNTNNSELVAYDGFFRNEVTSAPLSSSQDHSMRPFVDEKNGIVYAADDRSLKKVYIDGRYDEFKHISDIGYDVDGIKDTGHVYFSDGIGVVKIRTADMKPVAWSFTSNLGGGNGWAMGLRVVQKDGRDIAIVFNGNSILAFNDKLSLIDAFESLDTENDQVPPIEQLFLSTDSNWGFPDRPVRLEGRGYGSNESLAIKFAGRDFYARADQNGRFVTTLYVPITKPRITDIKVTGEVSGLTYSISFEIR